MYESDHPPETWNLNDVLAGTDSAAPEIGWTDNSLTLIESALDHPERAGFGHAERS